jgi:hypothetical protein
MAIMFLLSPWLRLNIRRAAILILITWLFSSLMAFPLLIVNEVGFFGENKRKITLKIFGYDFFFAQKIKATFLLYKNIVNSRLSK